MIYQNQLKNVMKKLKKDKNEYLPKEKNLERRGDVREKEGQEVKESIRKSIEDHPLLTLLAVVTIGGIKRSEVDQEIKGDTADN